MKKTILVLTALVLTTPAFADGQLDAETAEKIETWLASIDCQMDTDDIEVEDDGYDLDDVICKGGDQFDIKLDKNLKEVSRQSE